jgi:chromosome segregation ATPase
MKVQQKLRVIALALVVFNSGLYMGCHSGPGRYDSAAYSAIEREADRNISALVQTGADLAAAAGRIDGRAERVQSELHNLEAAIGESALPQEEKSALVLHTSRAREETALLLHEASILRRDTRRLNEQMAEQERINTSLIAEHDKWEAAAAAVQTELENTKKKLASVKGQRDRCLLILTVLAAAILCIAGFKLYRAVKPF